MVETDELSLVHFAQKCINRNIHVHLDKPAGGNVEDFELLLRTAKRKNLKVQLAYMYRYNLRCNIVQMRLRAVNWVKSSGHRPL